MKELTPIQLEIRAKMISLAEKQGLSLQEISDLFHRPIKKSRIWQILEEQKK